MRDSTRRTFVKTAGAGAIAVGIAGCTDDEEIPENGNGNGDENGNGQEEVDDYPPSALNFINAYSEGGGVDTNFRQIQPYFEDHIGANFNIEYRDGAGTRIAATTVAEDDEVLRIGGTLSPATPAAVAFDEADGTEPDYTLDDLRPLGTLSGEAAIIRVRPDDDRFQTIEELVDYASENPGELTVGASGPTNRNMLSIIQLMEETDAEFTLVPYDGGGPTQTALLQEEIDVAARSVYNSADIADETTCLAIYSEENPEPDLTNDAPPINEALGTDINYAPTNGTQFYYVSADAAAEHPSRYEHVQEAFYEAHQDEEYRDELEDIGELGKLVWNDPDETEEIMRSAYETYQEFIPLFEEYVQN